MGRRRRRLDHPGEKRSPASQNSAGIIDANGNYSFNDLLTGLGIEYTVREVQLAGWTLASPLPPTIFLMPGQIVNGVDFGNQPLD
jgi:hypothetical protein